MSHFSSSNINTKNNPLDNTGVVYMGSLNPSSELTLDFRPTFIPKTIGQFLGNVSRIGNVSEKVLQVDEFVNRLETETRKIEAFKGELPLCMLLINEAINALKEESIMLKKSSKPEPVFEEFIPLKTSYNDDSKLEMIGKQKDNGDKKNWLSSTQLWNTNENLDQKAKKQENKVRIEEDNAKKPSFIPGIKNLLCEINGNNRLIHCSSPNLQPKSQQQISRKQRRCWSTELHKRFLGALQQLGGSQAATPKQIRELMKVDGLTNDEVKSHLQKYRLHTRRLSSSNSNKYIGFSKCSNSNSDSPDGPLRNGGSSMEDEEEDEKSDNYCWN